MNLVPHFCAPSSLHSFLMSEELPTFSVLFSGNQCGIHDSVNQTQDGNLELVT